MYRVAVCLAMLGALSSCAWIRDPGGPTPREWHFWLQYTPGLGYDPDHTWEFAQGDIHEDMETAKDCAPSVMRMWLKYFRNVAYREGRLFHFEDLYGIPYDRRDDHYRKITTTLADYTVMFPAFPGRIPEGIGGQFVYSGYECSPGCPCGTYGATEELPEGMTCTCTGTKLNTLDLVKWSFGKNDLVCDFSNYGTFVADQRETPLFLTYTYESHLVLTAQFVGFLYDHMYFDAFSISEDFRDPAWPEQETEYHVFDDAGLWNEFALMFPYAVTSRLCSGADSCLDGYHLGDATFPDYVATNDDQVFMDKLCNWFYYHGPEEEYQPGTYGHDRGLMLLTRPDGVYGLGADNLHFVLVTGLDITVPAGGTLQEDGEYVFRVEDPAYGSWQPVDADDLFDWMRIINSNGMNRLAYRYIGVFMSAVSQAREQAGVRGLGDIMAEDASSRSSFYHKMRQAEAARRAAIQAILQLLLEED